MLGALFPSIKLKHIPVLRFRKICSLILPFFLLKFSHQQRKMEIIQRIFFEAKATSCAFFTPLSEASKVIDKKGEKTEKRTKFKPKKGKQLKM